MLRHHTRTGYQCTDTPHTQIPVPRIQAENIVTNINPVKHTFNQNNIYKYTSHFKENIAHLHFKAQSVNAY
jgi:hypothetical protein